MFVCSLCEDIRRSDGEGGLVVVPICAGLKADGWGEPRYFGGLWRIPSWVEKLIFGACLSRGDDIGIISGC